MTKILLALSFFVFSFSYSQDWKLIFEADGTLYYYKPNTKNTAWIKEISETTEYYPKENSSVVKIVDGYTLSLWKFDCENKKAGLLKMNIYSTEGKLLQDIKVDEYLAEMTFVVPDTVGEGFFNAFCINSHGF